MRPIYLTKLDKNRPAIVLTRAAVRGIRSQVTVVPITSNARGLGTEVAVGESNGLDRDSVANCDNIITTQASNLGTFIGYLLDSQEAELKEAIEYGFGL